MSTFTKVKWGDGLEVTDEGAGVIRVDGGGAVGPAGPAGPAGPTGPQGPPGAGGHTIQDEGTALTARAALDFVGAGVTASDDAANNRTLVTVPGGGTPPDATTTTKGIVQLAGDLAGTATSPQIAAGVIVDADVAAANKDGTAVTPSLRTLGTGAQQAAAGNDARFSDARAPTAHHTTHEPGGSDAMAVDAAVATGSLRTLGTGAQQAAAGNDSRLTNARIPTAHATTHQPGGSDAMAVDAATATGSLRTLGTGAQQAAAGNDSRFTDSRPPSGTAGGDLSGTYPNPQLAAGVIVDADVSATAAIAKSKLAALNIVNADVAAAAAITYAKLALAGSIVNADIATAAAIGVAKLAAGTNGQILTTVAGAPAWAAAPAAPTVGYGTTLPASPVDGQEAILVDSTTNPSYQWRFRYNAGSSSSYKWEFVGGAPKITIALGAVTQPGFGSWAAIAGTDLIAPRSGDYKADYSARATAGTTGNCSFGVCNASVGPTAISPVTTAVISASWYMGFAGSTSLLGFGAGATMRLTAIPDVANTTFSQMWLAATPIRVS